MHNRVHMPVPFLTLLKSTVLYASVPIPMKARFTLILFSMFFLPYTAFAADGRAQLVDRVMAVVNDEVITQSEFDSIFRPIYEEMVQGGGKGDDFKKEMNQIRLKLLNQMIEDRIVYQEAKKLGIQVNDAEVALEMERLKSQFPDAQAFEAQMKGEGIDLADIEKRFRERIAIEKLHEYVIRGRVTVPPAELEQYYKDHPDEFVEKETIELSVISLRKSEEARTKGTMDEAAKKKAERALSELKHGVDFNALAQKYSQDSYAPQGGLIGPVERGSMMGTIEETLFNLPADSVSDVMETETAYHVFRVGTKTPRKEMTFEESRDQIYNLLFRGKAHERFVAWMEDLKKKSFITIR